MSKIDIISGFLGAGKTTLIKKLLKDGYKNEKIVLIENEFGEIGIDGGFLEDAGIQITEMNSGCICCSLVGDFSSALIKVIDEYNPDRIIIEPSGVGKLSDVIKAVKNIDNSNIHLNSFSCVVDILKVDMYMKNFKEFYNNQIEYANTIILSRTNNIDHNLLDKKLKLIKDKNPHASIITTPWDKLSSSSIVEVMEKGNTLADELYSEEVCEKCGHVHHHDDTCCGEHHEHDHVHGEHDGGHSHSHEHGEHCSCGCDGHHDHDHHEHHHADEIFTSYGKETANIYTYEQLEKILEELKNEEKYGTILRAKGIVEGNTGDWYYFDLVPNESEIRIGKPQYTGRICIIGSNIKEELLQTLFSL
ncbi:MAG: GTP-binding protein [Erysipelotrichaceae bacterium]